MPELKKILLPLVFVLIFSRPVSGNFIGEDSVFNHYFRQDIGGWVAADATFSIALPNNKTLWLFGDTFIGSVNEENHTILAGSKFIRNSAVLQDGISFTTLYPGSAANPSDFLPSDHPDSTWYWPEHGFLKNDSLFIFAVKFIKTNGNDDGFNFEFAGNDIIVFKYPGFNYLKTIPIEASFYNEVYYGDRILEEGEYLYIYGRKTGEYNIAYPHVARTKKDDISGNWEFFNGSGWSNDPGSSSRINDFQVSQQYGVFKHEGKYILITQDIWFSREVWSFTSATPYGPWGNKTSIYKTPEKYPNTFTYNAYPHPQFNEKNELLLSYNTNGDFFSIFSNVEIYRPTFVRIPFQKIDAEFSGSTAYSSFKTAKSEYLLKNYPNPFNDFTTIEYTVVQKGWVSIELTEISGRKTVNLLREIKDAGSYSMNIDLSFINPGLYLCTLVSNGTSVSNLMIKLP